MSLVKILYLSGFVMITGVLMSCNGSKTSTDKTDIQVNQLLSRMTLDEKIGQMTQIDPGFAGGEEQLKKSVRDGRYGSVLNLTGVDKVNEFQKIAVEESRLGIPLLIGRDVIHGFRTVFPIPLGMAATWNPELIKKAYRISAIECSAEGVKWTFAPMLDICWDPRWGRIAEGCGEDPLLASTMATAMVEGIQGPDLKDPSSVASCAKHFAGYGFSEAGRDYNTTYISEPVMRNVVLKPFKAAKEAGALTFMSGFNDLNGVPASGNEFLLKQILRKEWGFQGMVVSDWASISEMISHGYCTNEKEAALKALNSGVDMEMSSLTYSGNIKQLLQEGKLTQKSVDEAVKNILKIKFKLGLFENPYTGKDAQKQTLSPEFLDHARKVARESTVMLKNTDKTLPLSKNIHSLAVIGPLADSPRDQLGTWVLDGKAENSVTPLAAIREVLGAQRVNFIKGLQYSRDHKTEEFTKTIALAKQSDAIVFFGGEEWILSGEGQSRGEINLPGAQDELITELAKTGKPLVVVLMAGRPLAIGNVLNSANAVLYGWHGGTMQGPALADLIFGKESPSGKLPVTFVKGSGQIPFYYYHNNTGRPASSKSWIPLDSIPVVNPQTSLGYKSFHLDYGFTPLLPFGFGLSYTTFRYSDLNLSSMSMTGTGSINVKATVTNTGEMDADEVIQFYIRDRVGSITRPVRELKGYKRVTIPQGQKTVVEFRLTPHDLEFFNGTGNVIEPGEFDVWVGPNSAEGLHGEFTLQ